MEQEAGLVAELRANRERRMALMAYLMWRLRARPTFWRKGKGRQARGDAGVAEKSEDTL